MGSARKSAPWRVIRSAIIRRDDRKCRRCGAVQALTVHHIKPRDQGGLDVPRNLLTLCGSCHDWAEIETAENGLAWVKLIQRPEQDESIRIWYVDRDGIITAEIFDEEE